jgi:hypothetical protein
MRVNNIKTSYLFEIFIYTIKIQVEVHQQMKRHQFTAKNHIKNIVNVAIGKLTGGELY